ncbi:hypothetical protein [Homoserinibacter gongjuensis]|uniref:Uncharacterized protein n=1 Tax=Homoserinibacter gongjuensis TaxID=1162968 RepID=A0ABQ6JQQ1_9MICO|nr:hypothetical protein [Homoserinibacter gongjuensis]GMA89649.1 hypothetical protein GCM10025869_01780 [Homoserinibacter gongjuensis]
MFVLQGVNAVFGIALVWLGISSDLLPVVIVGGVLIAVAVVLLVVTLRMGAGDPNQGPLDRR